MTPSYAPPSSPPDATRAPSRRVTDAPTRMFHWLFALSFAGAYLTAESEHWRLLHVTLGYTLAGLLAFRVGYGLWGPRQMGLSLLWRKLGVAPAWLKSLKAAWTAGDLRAVNWRQGQNMAVALAVLLMLALVLPVTLTGYGTFNDWGTALGEDWLEELHEFFSNVFLLVVLAHLAMMVTFSVMRRQNMAQPMLTGRVPGQGPSPVQHNRRWLAALLLLGVLGFGAWQWLDAHPSSRLSRGIADPLAEPSPNLSRAHVRQHERDGD
ncbi:MAG: cytochrome b/b6 domain-containing protein [Hydrogenophaga sp.]|nr:cytochrome b/b6 domain-containing protein [Hydrogenophaga sp.]